MRTTGSAWTSAGVAFGDLLAEVEHGDPVGDAHHQLHDVLDQEDRDPAAAEAEDPLAELADLLGVHARGRLVEQQELRARAASARASSRRRCSPNARLPASSSCLRGEAGELEQLADLGADARASRRASA